MSQDKQRIQSYVYAEIVEGLDDVSEKFGLSRSRMVCDLLAQKIGDKEDLSKAVEDALSDDLLRVARKKKKEDELLSLQEEREKKAGYKDQMRGYFRGRLEGDEAYEPELQAELAEGYKTHAEIWYDDPEVIEDRKQWVDEQMEVYRAGYYARKHADSIDAELQPHNRNKSWMDIGDDLYRLRSRQDEVYQWVRQRADNSGSDYKETVVEYICNEWSVGKAAVLLFLEQLVDDPDKNVKTMLREGGAVMADQEALGVGSSLRELPGAFSQTETETETEQVVEAEVVEAGPATDRQPEPKADQVVDVEPVESETDQDVDADRRPDGEADRAEVEASAPASTDGGAHSDTVGDFTAEELAPDHLIQTAEELLRGGEEPHMVELELRRETATDTQRKCALEAARQRVEQADAEQAVSGSVAAVGGEADE